MAFPSIDPVALRLGPLEIKWYALAYVAGLVFAVAYMKRLVRTPRLWGEGPPPPSPGQIDDLFIWATLGVVVGGRLGYVLFYDPSYFLQEPLAIARLWQGGMSFHGGFMGVIAACWLQARTTGIMLDRWLDLAAAAVPVGLGLGRIANFINGELYGRASTVPWAVVFPGAGPLATPSEPVVRGRARRCRDYSSPAGLPATVTTRSPIRDESPASSRWATAWRES